MDNLLQNLRYSVRTLRKAPGFTTIAVLTLALGIGANTAVFSVINTVLLKPLPFTRPQELAMVWGAYPDFGRTSTSLPDFLDYRAGSSSFAQLSALAFTSSNLDLGRGEPERVSRALTTADLFQTLGVLPAAGRFFVPDEDRGGANSVSAAEQVVVISHDLWQSRFAGSADAIGRTVHLHGSPYTVIGVAPPGFQLRSPVDVWTPLNLNAEMHRRGEFLTLIGRLRSGGTLQQAERELKTISERLAEQYPDTNRRIRAEVVSLHEQVIGPVRPALLAFMAAVGLVLLIACANVANLMLTRASTREREIAVRAALGAGYGRIARQLLTESMVLALVGAGLGLFLAHIGVEVLRNVQIELVPRSAEIAIDIRVLGFTVLLALVTGVLFGLVPALQLGRTALSGSLRSGGRGIAGQAGVRRLRAALVLGEVAVALVLLVGAGLLVRSLERMQQVDAGFEPSGVLTARVSLPATQYPEAPQRLAFYDRLLETLSSASGVQSAALGSGLPLGGSASYEAFSVEGRPDDRDVMQDAQAFTVTRDYFSVLRVPLLQGRVFEDQDHTDAPRVALVNQTLARRYWPDRSPIGQRITFSDPSSPAARWLTVVGVVGDTRVTGLTDVPYAQIYQPHTQTGQGTMVVLLRTTGDPTGLAGTVREAIRSLDPGLPIYDLKSMEAYVGESVAQPRISTWLTTTFAGIALLLAAIGIYGVISYSVTQRAAEVGVRIALGARPVDVLRLIITQGMRPAIIGIAVGLAAAWLAARLIRGMLFGISAYDPVTFVVVPVFLAGIALLATYVPARRATRVDPMVALRAE
jgi:putative ABC transport system permease protein